MLTVGHFQGTWDLCELQCRNQFTFQWLLIGQRKWYLRMTVGCEGHRDIVKYLPLSGGHERLIRVHL